jgi:nascent polypeptide-associated complex subunit beta
MYKGPHAPIHVNSARPSTPICCSSACANSDSAVHASVPANTFAIYGVGEDKELTELVPGILNQLGPDSLASLRKLAESYQSMQKEKGEGKDDDEDDDDIPDLVAGDNFESAEKADDKPDVE